MKFQPTVLTQSVMLRVGEIVLTYIIRYQIRCEVFHCGRTVRSLLSNSIFNWTSQESEGHLYMCIYILKILETCSSYVLIF